MLLVWLAVSALVYFGSPGPAQAVTVCKDGSCDHTSIKEALSDPDHYGEGVFVHPGVYYESRLYIGGTAQGNRTLMISTEPENPESTVIDATGSGYGVIQALHANMTIRGFTLRGGKGGVRTASPNTVFQNMVIENNDLDNDSGGGIRAPYGPVTIIDSVIRNNSARNGGGIAFGYPSTLTIIRSRFEGNLAHGMGSNSCAGGGISIGSGVLRIDDSVIIGNRASHPTTSCRGAGINSSVETHLTNVNLLNNIVVDNFRPNNGGGIYKSTPTLGNPDLFINGGIISGNQADQGGGVYLSWLSKITLNSGTITNNLARDGVVGSGGGIWCAEAAVQDVVVTPGSVVGNSPDEISCITNPELSKIIVKKITDPDTSTETFEFSTNYDDGFSLGNGQLYDSGDLLPTPENGGVPYSVSETIPDGWDLQSATCTDGSSPSAITLSEGEIVTCTFANLQRGGDIIVEKVTDPGTSTETFEFATNYGAGFILGNGQTHESGRIATTSENGGVPYSVIETIPEGWDIKTATCSDGSSPESITLSQSEVVTCTFENAQRGNIIVKKEINPDTSELKFEFTSNYSGGNSFFLGHNESHNSGPLPSSSLPAVENYTVAEVEVGFEKGFWDTTVSCLGTGDSVKDPNSIELEGGETVTCTFTNVQREAVYVALGDSYASGEGAGNYFILTDLFLINQCHRSKLTWSGEKPGGDPHLAILEQPANFVFKACSGALAGDLFSTGDWDEPAQLDEPALADADLVTVSIGGNDTGFTDILKECFFEACEKPGFTTKGHTIPLEVQIASNINALTNFLPNVYNRIESLAPNAMVAVAGYPYVFSTKYSPSIGYCAALDLFWSVSVRSWFQSIEDDLNSVIKSATVQAGVEFVPMQPVFNLREVCSRPDKNDEWILRFDLIDQIPFDTKGQENLHPKPRGQAAYAIAFKQHLKSIGFSGHRTPSKIEPPNQSSSIQQGAEPPDVSVPFQTGKLSASADVPSCGTVNWAFEPDQVIELSGSNFKSGSSVNLYFLAENSFSQDLGTVGAGEDGSILTNTAIPTDAPVDSYSIIKAVGETEDGRSLSLYHDFFTIPSTSSDGDRDSVPDVCDNCASDFGLDQTDTDSDGLGDLCDACPNDFDNDFDGDGVCGNVDICPFDPTDSVDENGFCFKVLPDIFRSSFE